MGRRRIPRVEAPALRTLAGSPVHEVVDLHGLSADDARRRLEMAFARWTRAARGEVVQVVTGRGAHSRERPVLREVVLEALTGWARRHVADWSVDRGAGAYLLRIRGRR